MTYQLFVARDFDVIERKIDADDREAAERLAAEAIVQAYGLEPDSFDELVSQTDGYYLEQFEKTAPLSMA